LGELLWTWAWRIFTAKVVVGGFWSMTATTYDLTPFPLRDGLRLTQVPDPASVRHVAAGPFGLVAARWMRQATAL
jgi:hypothetical protein